MSRFIARTAVVGIVSAISFLAFASAALASQPNLDLLSDANIRLDGAVDANNAGYSVAGAGDVNGDGRDDVIVGAPGASNNGRDFSGSAYVVFGSASPTSVDLLAANFPLSKGFRIDGAADGEQAGWSVAGAGDVNGDGRDDVIVGAPGASNNGRNFSGSAYVVLGSASPTNVDLLPANFPLSKGFRIDGAVAGDAAGVSVAGAGDVNGDGRDDVIAGAFNASNNGRNFSGSAYVVYGSASPTNVDLLAANFPLSTGFRIDGAVASDQAGISVAGAGDVNGDGRDDVIVGVPNAGNNGRDFSGSAYVVLGSASPTNVDLLPANFPLSKGFRVDGAVASDNAGYSVAGAGDVNGDGRDDVIVGAPGADNNSRTGSGSAYVVYGSASPTNVDLLAANFPLSKGFRIDGAVANDSAGRSAAAAGDVNGDGRDDVIVGAPGADNNSRPGSGSAYVVYGSASPTNVDLLPANFPLSKGFRIDGAVEPDVAGHSAAGAGDVNGDGRDDVIVGAHDADNNGRSDSGSAYVITGDSDQDGVRDDTDNCRSTANPTQANNDNDALGDACDQDDDGDGAADSADNCPNLATASQADTDGDGIGDACDPDDDNDGVADSTDNCRLDSNPDQANVDGDAHGDACDTDNDNDGVADKSDNCALAPNADQADADADGIGDGCDPTDNRPPAAHCIVPSIKRGSSLRATRTALADADCTLGKVTKAHSRSVPRRKLIKLKQKAGTVLDAGSAVGVVLSKGPKPD